MKKTRIYMTLALVAGTFLSACHESYVTYSDAEYILFADTLAVYPVQSKGSTDKAGNVIDTTFCVPIVSTVKRDYDRTVGVEIIDKGSNAIERKHYRLETNTVTIKAGQTRADLKVHGYYTNIEPTDSLGFTLQLVMRDELIMPQYGNQTKVVMMKSGPFDIDKFTGYCVLSSMFLQEYSQTRGYNRLIKTEAHPTLDNTIICKNWLKDGYDVTLTFHTDDPLKPFVTMEKNQVAADQGSFFGIAYGQWGDKLLVTSSNLADSIYYPLGGYLYLWSEISVEEYGVVGHFYNVMQWVSDEEGRRIEREGF